MTQNQATIKGTTKLLAVIGSPISHSLSPIMHNAAIAHLGLDYAYLPLEIEIENLAIAMQGLATIKNLVGFNLTIPHKQEIIPLLTDITAIAKAVGAVNTVKLVPGGWLGTNTDVAGFLTPLQKLDRDWQKTAVVILGNGGAAKAVVAGCLELGCPKIDVVGRDPAKLNQFHQQVTAQMRNHNLRVHSWSNLDSLLEVAGLLVNTTPIGMGKSFTESPLSQIQIGNLPSQAIVYDLIYNPSPTRLLQLAKSEGLMVIDGLEMLLNQGALALEFWLEVPAPLEIMAAALKNALAISTK
jgi:shikimate dehydrogenase